MGDCNWDSIDKSISFCVKVTEIDEETLYLHESSLRLIKF